MTVCALSSLRLRFQFDAELLQRDLDLVREDEWTPHYNERDFGGEWRGAALRSATGMLTDLVAGSGGPIEFRDTPLLGRCEYLREVLAAFRCPLKSARLLGLAPGSFIREHSDHALAFEDGEVRIHIPVRTNPGVEFYLSGERLLLEEGQCYYVNVNLPHRVSNRGAEWRVHLVIDAAVDGWLGELFADGLPITEIAPAANGFGAYRELVFRDPTLQRRLFAVPDPDLFVDEALRLGREAGFDFVAADVEAAYGPSPSGEPDADWLPVAFRMRDGRPHADWVYRGARRFTEPFFEDTVQAALQNPFARMFQREAPLAAAGTGRAGVPAGFIFHMSRCGSTLLTQMLAALPEHTVISEAPPIDEAIQNGEPGPLRALIAALCRGRTFVKLDAWHIHKLPLIRRAFPETPWIFLYRDPAEVMASQLRRPGRQALPGALDPALVGLRLEDITGLDRTEWCARVLEGFCTAALGFRDDPRGLLVNYRELPGAAWGRVARHFGLRFTDEEVKKMEEAARFDAKDPAAVFHPAGDGLRRESPDADEVCRTMLNQLYAALEAVV